MKSNTAVEPLEFRDPGRAKALAEVLESLCREIVQPVTIMHVCGSHEQSIARFGLRSLLPATLRVLMGPGCPVCVTDMPEVDEAVALARQGLVVATFGDMFRVPGTVQSLAEVKAEGADVRVVYSPFEAVKVARQTLKDVVFFATGFETTAVATAALVLDDLPANLSILSAHKYVPPAMEIVAGMPESRVQGFLAAGHAAIITGSKVFEPFVARHRVPVATGGFEPLDILAAIAELLKLIRDREPRVVNAYPRCVTAQGNRQAQDLLWEVFQTEGGDWRGIAHIPNGNLRLRSKYAWVDARSRFKIDVNHILNAAPRRLAKECICGSIMAGIASPSDCRLFGKECTPQNPVGACMVSSEGTCKIWNQYGGLPVLRRSHRNRIRKSGSRTAADGDRPG